MLKWWQSFLKRLKRLLGQPQKSIEILESWHSDWVSVYRLSDRSTPGLVEMWRIDRRREYLQFFLCTINEAQLREDLGQGYKSFTSLSQKMGDELLDSIVAQAKQQTGILSTHLWVTGWLRTTNGIDKKGRSYQTQRIEGVKVVACDLQGTTGAYAGNRFAVLFGYKAIKQLAANEFREYNQHRTWRAAVSAIDWVEWLSGLASRYIDETHVLQPKKYRK